MGKESLTMAASEAANGKCRFKAAHPLLMSAAATWVGGLVAAVNIYGFIMYDEVKAVMAAQGSPIGILASSATTLRLGFRQALSSGGSITGLFKNASTAVQRYATAAGSFLRGAAGAQNSARFIVNSAGVTLDTAAIHIPGRVASVFGKIDYLLGTAPSADRAKVRTFKNILGFTKETLGNALRQHLIANFESTTASGTSPQGAAKYAVEGFIEGPSGAIRMIKSVWQAKNSGVDLVTAHATGP